PVTPRLYSHHDVLPPGVRPNAVAAKRCRVCDERCVPMSGVTLRGRLSRPAEARTLPSGDRLVQLELTVARPGDKAESVPVVCFDAPATVAGLDVNDEVVILGRVRRRFFKTAAGTQSRTEVVADQVVLSRHTKKVGTAIDRAHQLIDQVMEAS